ncbi:MAG: histidinol dehydrogenase [Pseudobacteriovorax sp.]|nr:histidinol dehydrogenase [Pseudobacteriovorax sp.]
MKTINWSQLSQSERIDCLSRPALGNNQELTQKVSQILATVKDQGDQAIASYTKAFDGVDIKDIRVTSEELLEAEGLVDQNTKIAMDTAIANIKEFHKKQLSQSLEVETMPGVSCRRISRPIEKVGLYVPGGTAPLPSTVMMLAIPASIAGCQVKVLCTPPRKDGTIDPNILVAASKAGITDIYKVGGAQAIGAMAYGTETIPKVFKIFGPGNSWVTEAKVQVAADPNGAVYDMPAGPSEVLVIADKTANTNFIAADLLSQAEHGKDSQVLLVTTSATIAAGVTQAVSDQLKALSRKDIAASALENSSIVLVDSLDEAISVSNAYGPEHLIIQVEDPEAALLKITNAGSIFLGPWTPESVGDYASGTNHVLPTYGYTKSVSGLALDSFMTQISVQKLTEIGLRRLGPSVEQLAAVEGLDAHKNAVTIRLNSIKETAK